MIESKLSRRAALAGAAAFACAPAVVRAAAPAAIQIVSSPDDDMTPVLYAQSAGLFAKAGIDVTVRRASSGAASAAAVIGGSADVGKSSILPLIAAHARGIKLVAIAPCALHRSSSPDAGILVAADSPLRSARDLDGKTVSTAALNDLNWVATQAWIDKNGGSSQTVQFVEIPNTAVLPALEQGRIAAGAVAEPFVTQGIRSGKARTLGDVLDGISNQLLESAFFVTADYAAKNRALVLRIASVIRAAAAYTNTHHEETIPLLAAFSGADPATIAQVHRTFIAPRLDPRDLQPTIDAAAKYRVIPQPFDARDLIAGP